MQFLSFLRKYGETEDPLFKDLPEETPPPDEGDVGMPENPYDTGIRESQENPNG